ncbi:polysaccharide deacetylase family protein, partial [Micrococcus luteus]
MRPSFFDCSSRAAWSLLLLLGLTSVMLLDGYLRSEIGNDARVRDGAAYDKVPQKILDGGPLLTFTGGTAKTQSVPKKTIVLTFDDGPTPTWTPQILKVLEDNNIEATFFMVGSMVSRYPGVVKDLVDQGNEVGIHTFTHVDLSYQGTGRLQRELKQTQLALAGAAGITTTLFRAPYSSEINAVDNYSWPVYKEIGNLGYTSVFVDTDSDDWKKPGVSKIVQWATPKNSEGAVVLMHDAGGDRSETVKALDTYIKKMKAKGYSFTTVSGAMAKLNGAPNGAGRTGATGSGQAVEAGVGQTGTGAGAGVSAGAGAGALGEQPGGTQSAPGSGSTDNS